MKSVLVGLTASVCLAAQVLASPAPPKLTVDKTFGKVAGWSIGYSESLGGCLAAASYENGTTIWFGIGGSRGTSYLAFTNPAWRSIELGEQYDIRLVTKGQGRWQGTFTGFDRGEAKGLFQAGLKERFVADLSSAGALSVELGGKQITVLSLVGSTEAFDAVLNCQRDATVSTARTSPVGPASQEPSKSQKSTQGTGFYVSTMGHVLTNNHVIDGCSDITVSRVGLPPEKARLVATDSTNDLAVLSTERTGAPAPPFAVRARVGESVFAFGFPLNGMLATTGNFTMGNVTATAGLKDDTRHIQISVPVQQGNSGGPLVDQYGNVVGVIDSKLNVLAMARVTSDIAQNVNFAIKTTIALNFLEANGIEAPINAGSTNPMSGEAIAEKAQAFTVRVNCH